VRQQFLLDLGHSPTPGCRDHSKTDFFNGIGQNRKAADLQMSFRFAPIPAVHVPSDCGWLFQKAT
jgi:hypothetical protein